MFLKRGHHDEKPAAHEHEAEQVEEQRSPAAAPKVTASSRISSSNTILKGSRLVGDINVTCDLELSGDIEGNITSEKDSKIVIKGTCKGNIHTKEGDVNIEGELIQGNIVAGSSVTIWGKFNGGEVTAKDKISVNGEFNGKLEAREIEIGPGAKGKGEIFYKEYISIARGASVECQIHKMPNELKLVKTKPEKAAEDTTPSAKEISNG